MAYIKVMVGLMVLLLTLPDFVLSGCEFGPDNTDQLTKRNSAILHIMNHTLFNYTDGTDLAVKSLLTSSFNLRQYLKNSHFITSANFLDFVCMGKLVAIDWTSVDKVSSVTTAAFVYSVHVKLQELAVYYSFSMGIFRPYETQFKFTGYTAATNSTMDNSALDLNCMAASQFLWRVSTDLRYWLKLSDKNSTDFAIFATMIERFFEERYRRNTTLNKEFIRANVIFVNTTENGRSIAFMETYFHNYSFQNSDIVTRTKIAELPHMAFDNGAGSPSIVVISGDSQYTKILSSNRPTTDSPTIPASSPVISTEPATEVNGPTTVQTTDAPITSDLSLPSSSSTTTILYSIVGTEEITFSTNSNNTIYDTYNESTLLATSTSSLNQGLSSFSNTIMSVNYTSQVFQTRSLALDSTTVSPMSSSSFQNSSMPSSISSTKSPFITALNSISNSLGIAQSSQIPTNLISGTFNINQLANNSSTLTTFSHQTESIGTVGNQTNGIVGSTTGKTTFDPDPFFKADVPVVAKIYNDDYLLRLIGTMAPVTEKSTFISITLPAAIGMIAAVTFCMCFWQIDCLQGMQKT